MAILAMCKNSPPSRTMVLVKGASNAPLGFTNFIWYLLTAWKDKQVFSFDDVKIKLQASCSRDSRHPQRI